MVQVIAYGFHQISLPKDGFLAVSQPWSAKTLRQIVEEIRKRESRNPHGVFVCACSRVFRSLDLEVVSPPIGEIGELGSKMWVDGTIRGQVIEEIESSPDGLRVRIGDHGSADIELGGFHNSVILVAATNRAETSDRTLSLRFGGSVVWDKPWLALEGKTIGRGSARANILNIIQAGELAEDVFRPETLFAAALDGAIFMAAWPSKISIEDLIKDL